MYLDRPAFPILFPYTKILSHFGELLKAENWLYTGPQCTKIIFRPYWIFHYEIFSDPPGKGIKHLHSGTMKINTQNNRLFPFENIEYANLTHQINQPEYKVELEVQKPALEKADAEKIARLHLASQFEVDQDKVLLTDFKMMYIPIWTLKATLDKNIHIFHINANTGRLMEGTSIPQKSKGIPDFLDETLEELKSPATWLNYTQSIISDVIGFFTKSSWRFVGFLLILLLIALLFL